MISFSIPLVPPSVNHYKNPRKGGGWYVTKEAQAFIDAVGYLAPKGPPMTCEFYQVEMALFIPKADFLRGDLDNRCKVGLDALAHAGLIRDDRYITRLWVRKQIASSKLVERTEFTIIGL